MAYDSYQPIYGNQGASISGSRSEIANPRPEYADSRQNDSVSRDPRRKRGRPRGGNAQSPQRASTSEVCHASVGVSATASNIPSAPTTSIDLAKNAPIAPADSPPLFPNFLVHFKQLIYAESDLTVAREEYSSRQKDLLEWREAAYRRSGHNDERSDYNERIKQAQYKVREAEERLKSATSKFEKEKSTVDSEAKTIQSAYSQLLSFVGSLQKSQSTSPQAIEDLHTQIRELTKKLEAEKERNGNPGKTEIVDDDRLVEVVGEQNQHRDTLLDHDTRLLGLEQFKNALPKYAELSQFNNHVKEHDIRMLQLERNFQNEIEPTKKNVVQQKELSQEQWNQIQDAINQAVDLKEKEIWTKTQGAICQMLESFNEFSKLQEANFKNTNDEIERRIDASVGSAQDFVEYRAIKNEHERQKAEVETLKTELETLKDEQGLRIPEAERQKMDLLMIKTDQQELRKTTMQCAKGLQNQLGQVQHAVASLTHNFNQVTSEQLAHNVLNRLASIFPLNLPVANQNAITYANHNIATLSKLVENLRQQVGHDHSRLTTALAGSQSRVGQLEDGGTAKIEQIQFAMPNTSLSDSQRALAYSNGDVETAMNLLRRSSGQNHANAEIKLQTPITPTTFGSQQIGGRRPASMDSENIANRPLKKQKGSKQQDEPNSNNQNASRSSTMPVGHPQPSQAHKTIVIPDD